MRGDELREFCVRGTHDADIHLPNAGPTDWPIFAILEKPKERYLTTRTKRFQLVQKQRTAASLGDQTLA